jgi:hypothetical protein
LAKNDGENSIHGGKKVSPFNFIWYQTAFGTSNVTYLGDIFGKNNSIYCLIRDLIQSYGMRMLWTTECVLHIFPKMEKKATQVWFIKFKIWFSIITLHFYDNLKVVLFNEYFKLTKIIVFNRRCYHQRNISFDPRKRTWNIFYGYNDKTNSD